MVLVRKIVEVGRGVEASQEGAVLEFEGEGCLAVEAPLGGVGLKERPVG